MNTEFPETEGEVLFLMLLIGSPEENSRVELSKNPAPRFFFIPTGGEALEPVADFQNSFS